MEEAQEILHDLVSSGAYLAAGIARIDPDGRAKAALFGKRHPDDPAAPLPTDLRMRVASITKAATARLACELAVQGAITLDRPVRALLGDMPEDVTFDHLLSHTSGLTDRSGYLTGPGRAPVALAHVPERPPGTFFRYANLNYVLLGAALEAATGQRFDQLLRQHVLAPAGINGGPNWIGVTPRNALPLYQRQGGALVLEVDGQKTDWQADLIWAEGKGHALAGYVPVRDTSLMSPHAGLRLSLCEMARLAQVIGAENAAGRLQRACLWRYDGTNGAWCNGLFPAFGRGVTRFPGGGAIPSPLIGHAGHALGFTGGIWWNPENGVAHAYALTGAADETLPNGDEPFFPEAELRFLRLF